VKIVSLSHLSEAVQAVRDAGKTIVLCHGTFDLLHIGHIKYFQWARARGDFLVVTVTADQFVNKGPNRPVFNQSLRAEWIAALESVDLVAVVDHATSLPAIHAVRPSFYVKGIEYKNESEDISGNITREKRAVEALGGQLIFSDEVVFSSSKLLKAHFDVLGDQAKNFLSHFSKKFTAKQVLGVVDHWRSLRVAVVGDSIIDQYDYVDSLGQTGKGNVLSVRHVGREQFGGGAIAVANHLSGFVEHVTFLSALGDTASHEDFVRNNLNSNVDPIFEYFNDAPTVTKRRFVDDDLSKYFEVYYAANDPSLQSGGELTRTWINENACKFDLLVVADFGDGYINDSIAKELSRSSKYLAVNTQINSGNRGYHVITRYPKVNYVSLNEPEVRLAAHSRTGSLEDVCKTIAAQVGAEALAVTRGTKGASILSAKDGTFSDIPALSTKVVDRVGAGDAFLSISSLGMSSNTEPEMACFLGSVAAAMDVQIVCNQRAVDPVELRKYVTSLMK
jgi:rfaE bifunctional protein nucleotidyltransferase chain/domain